MAFARGPRLAGELASGVDGLAREPQLSFLELVDDEVGGLRACLLSLVDEVERVAVEAWEGGHPAKPCRQRVAVGHVTAAKVANTQRTRELLGGEGVVAPLVGRQVPVRRSRLLARRTRPVQGEGKRLPPGQRSHLFLSDVVSPATPVDAFAPA